MWFLAVVVCGTVGVGGNHSCSPLVMPFQFENYADCAHTGAANANNTDKTGVNGFACIKNDKGVTAPGSNVRQFTPDGTNDIVAAK